MKAPTTINGHKVLDHRPSEHGDDNFIVLVNTGDRITPWVTAVWSPRTGNEWVWGHYFSSESKARADFASR